MAGWYRVVKTIKGHRYLYDQQTWREGGRVLTRNRYLGRADGETTLPAQSEQKSSPVSGPPLFRDPADLGAALVQQFDIQQWAKDAQQQVFGGGSRKRVQRRKTRPAVNTTPSPKPAQSPLGNQTTDEEFHLSPHRRITDAYPKDFLGINIVWLAEQAKERGYNLYNALIKRVDSQVDIADRIAAIHAIMDEILTADPHDPTSTLDRSAPAAPASRQPSPIETQGREANHPTSGSGGHSPRDVQAEITDKIITAIETGQTNGTFQMPWQAVASVGLPVNTVTHQPYHGINVLVLSYEAMQHEWPNQWASFQQWKERGASVRKGERGTPIVFYSPIQIDEVEEDEDGKKHVVLKTIQIFRYSTVFNIAQLDNPPLIDRPVPPTLVNPIENVEGFINATKADIRYGGNRAFFSPSTDYIQMPLRAAFTGSITSSPTEAFYSTILHELCHWTGGESRLKRDIHNRFGDQAYAAEELVAEIGAAFSCAQLGITPELREDHLQYVSSWLKILKEDKRAIFTASAAASRAVEYLQTLQHPS